MMQNKLIQRTNVRILFFFFFSLNRSLEESGNLMGSLACPPNLGSMSGFKNVLEMFSLFR